MERLTIRKYGNIVSQEKEISCSNFCNNCSVGTGNCKYLKQMVEKLAEYEDTGLTPIICKTYKEFEDECIREGVQFKDILKLKDIVKGMTCETCRNHGKCDIEDNFNIKYCSDWERKDG